MKKIFLLTVLMAVASVCNAQRIKVHQGVNTNSFLISEVDSITHDDNNTVKVYCNTQPFEFFVNDVDSFTINTERIDYYSIPTEQLNGWDEGVCGISSEGSDFYIVSKTDSNEAEGGKVCICLNSLTNENVNKTVIFNYDANGDLYDIVYYGLEFKAKVVSDSMMFVAYNIDGEYIGNFSVPFEVIELDYSQGNSRGYKKQPFRPFWLNSRGQISLPKINAFGQKAAALADLYGKNALDAIGIALNLREGKYGEIVKNFLIGAFVGLAEMSSGPAILTEQAANKMSNHFYEKEKENYLGNAEIEITSIKRVDSKHITVAGILSDVSTIPSTYSFSSNVYGQSWPNVVYWGVAEGKSGQPGYYLNDECSGPLEITGDNFTYTFYIPETPGQIFYFRPFLAPKDKLEEIKEIPNPFTCIRYGERKEFMDFNVELSNFKQTECTKGDTDYKVQFTIDGRIPGIYQDLSGWGIYVKTQYGPEQRFYAKEASDFYPPTEKTFTCDITIDESEIKKEGNDKVAEVKITPFYHQWNDTAPIFLDSETYIIKIKGETTCPDANHPHWIDLGLPSGTQWRCCNEGASTPEAYGGYYQFGQVSSAPTLDQIKEFLNNTTSVWTTQNGVNGRKFTSKINGGTVFLPAAGSRWDGEVGNVGTYGGYWSSTPDAENNAYELYFFSGYARWSHDWGRGYERSVRPVR